MLDTLQKPSPRPRRLRSRRRGLAVLLTLIILLVGILVAGGLYWNWSTGASGPRATVAVSIPPGATGGEVGALLKEKGIIRSPLAFRLLARFRGFGSGFRSGTYDNLTTNMTTEQAIDKLKEGPRKVPSLSVLFPPGNTVGQTALTTQENLKIPAKTFLKQAHSGKYSIPPYLPAGTKTVEGFLFPDTYDFFANATADTVIARLLAQFETQAARLDWSKTKALKISPYQVVIVASLIQREAGNLADGPKIAAVIYNRLRRHMPLQVDATIQYARGSWKPISEQDKQIDSPYNTYLHTGLPPTPIVTPGLSALVAALNPARADYLYYVVTDCKGHSSFTSSYSAFLQLVASRPSC